MDAWGRLGERWTIKGYEKNIGVTENNIYIFFIVVMVSWMYKYITIHQIVCFTYMQFTVL